MSASEGRRLAGGRGNGGADARSHAASSVPQPAPSALGAQAGGTQTGITLNTGQLLYTVSDAAHLLSISRAHLYRLLARGDISSVTVGAGRCRRITRAALEGYIAHLEAGGAR